MAVKRQTLNIPEQALQVQKITPVFKDRIFIFVLSQLVVDVIEADALRISSVSYTHLDVYKRQSQVWCP